MIDLVIGGQFGSEGKGSVVSWLAQQNKYDLSVRIGSPNSGHTVVRGNKTYKLRQLPSSWPFQDCDLYLPAANVIDTDVLRAEITEARANGFTGQITVSPFAGVIEQQDKDAEKSIITGTTGSGSGALRARKLLRKALTFSPIYDTGAGVDCSEIRQDILPESSLRILVETTQGYGLSLNGGYYPFCTSIDLDVYHLLGDLEIPFKCHDINVIMVIRTFPVRIAGNSGPLLNELSWDTLRRKYGTHIPYEYTTVTQKLRRVGEFNSSQVRSAVTRLHPSSIVLNFFDYLYPNFDGFTPRPEMAEYLKHMEYALGHAVNYVGYGPGKIAHVKCYSDVLSFC